MQLRFAELKRARRTERLLGIGVPVIMMAAGFYPPALVSFIWLIEAYVQDSFTPKLDRSVRLGLIVGASVGIPLGMGGLIMLLRRRERRQRFNPELELLKKRIRLAYAPAYAPVPGGGALLLRGRF